MVNKGICRPSNSPYASPLHMVQKSNGDWRPCGDYRRLNTVTQPDRYPIPRLRDFTHNLNGCTHFSKIDLQSAYHQIDVDEESIPKTALTTPFGMFEFLKMPFGLRNASQTFQRLMNELFGDLDFVFVYIDDLLVASRSQAEHLAHLRIVFERLASYGILINPAKSEFGKNELEYLGHKVTKTGISPMPSKIEAIANFPRPNTQTQLRKFLGVINFYHQFIPNVAATLAPINALIRPKRRGASTNVVWTTEAQNAFNLIKTEICHVTELQYPIEGAKLSLAVDASDDAVGAVLQQTFANLTTPLSFFSKKLTPTESRYSTFGRELLAIYLAVKHFRYLLEGKEFTIFTDHKPITRAIHIANDRHSPREARHLSFIAQFTSDIRHIPGEYNLVADLLSRPPDVNSVSEDEPKFNLDEATFIKEQSTDNDLKLFLTKENSTLNLQKIQNIYCDVSHNKSRPFVPISMRKSVFDNFHNLAHPGIARTLKLISERYVWPEMKFEIREMARNCHNCQQSKILKHNKSAIKPSSFSGGKFDFVNVDIIGPLPPSENYKYALVMVDRFTRWFDVIPIYDITALTVAKTFMLHWIARHGIPSHITSDRGAQFTSALWKNLTKTFGIAHSQTTSYHPQANGLVERVNRDVKTALIAQDNPTNWVDNLPLVLLALRTQYKEDLKCTPAEMTFGTTLRLPGELIDPPKAAHFPQPQTYVENLREFLSTFTYTPPRIPNNNKDKLDKNLETCTHVYVRIDAVKPSLTRPYTGPFRVLKRSPKYFILDINGKHDRVSVDRLKVAVMPPRAPPQNSDQQPAIATESTIYRCKQPELPNLVCVPALTSPNFSAELPYSNEIDQCNLHDATQSPEDAQPPPPATSHSAPKSQIASHNKHVTFGQEYYRIIPNLCRTRFPDALPANSMNIRPANPNMRFNIPVRNSNPPVTSVANSTPAPQIRTRSGRLVRAPNKFNR